VSFEDAALAWLDPRRVTRADRKHSSPKEQRYFLFGEVSGSVLTVRFSSEGMGSGSLELVTGEKEGRSMSKRIDSDDRYSDAPPDVAEALAASEPVADDFPSPEELARELGRPVTIRLDPAVYDWFRRPGPGYQTRINAVLRHYVRAQEAKGGGLGTDGRRSALGHGSPLAGEKKTDGQSPTAGSRRHKPKARK
jgi:uncharacterized protein (DUF4415 family)